MISESQNLKKKIPILRIFINGQTNRNSNFHAQSLIAFPYAAILLVSVGDRDLWPDTLGTRGFSCRFVFVRHAFICPHGRLLRSALVNIHRKALLSSVGFRKRMTSRSPRGSSCDSCKLRFDRPL